MCIGLVLSGGMGKGAYQIGALVAISEWFKPSDFEYVSAASVGVLNTYTFLTDNLEEGRKIWESVNPNGEKRFITSMLRSTYLQDKITEIVSTKQIENNFYFPLLDIANKELSYYNFKNINPKDAEDFLKASVAMPIYNKGININGKTLYDGAVVDNIPIYPVLENELDYVICIYFDDVHYVFEDHEVDNKIIKLTFPDDKIISNSVNISHDSITHMIDAGYERTKMILSDVFAGGTSDLDTIYERIAARAANEDKKNVRITGDVVVTNMNRIVKKVVNHKRIHERDNKC